jgi:hypothetical protein
MLDENEKNVEKDEPKAEEIVIETTSKLEQQKEEPKAVKVDKMNDAVDEIEKSVAEDAENDESKEDESPAVDYDTFSLEELVSSLEKTLSSNPVQKIKSQVEGIKSAFNQKFGAILAEKKAAFLEEGGNSIDFQFSSPLKTDYNNLLSDYKKQRDAFYKNVENNLNENFVKREQVIENLKNLIDEANTSTMYKNFKEIQDTWRTIGSVPKSHYNDTWKTYHHHVERFYDLLHLSNDFRDLDFKHNLEKKNKNHRKG